MHTTGSLNNFRFWSVSEDEVIEKLNSSPNGLSGHEVRRRLQGSEKNLARPKKKKRLLSLFIFHPLILLLLFAALLSLIFGDKTEAIIIMTIVLVSGLLGYLQEKKAAKTVEKLLALVKIKVTVLREGRAQDVNMERIVRGDILIFKAGDIVPADCRILEAQDCFVDEATLTGETMAVEKSTGLLPAEIGISKRTNSLFSGTHVISGQAKAVVVHLGKETEFGKISQKLEERPPETAFEKGVKKFGYFLMLVTFILVGAIFCINFAMHRPILSSLLFSLALAVGLTPQLLPAIISVNLAHGANAMAKKKVIVKKLVSIEDFGSMNVLCVDKTGTITQGKMILRQAIDSTGSESAKSHLFGAINASMQSGYTNPLDRAILETKHPDISSWKKLDEIPYDFIRKRISVLAATRKQTLMIMKGAVPQVLGLCTQVELGEGVIAPFATMQEEIASQFEKYSRQGLRVLALAYRPLARERISRDDEKEMIFLGFLIFYDPPKKGVKKTIAQLAEYGVSLKLITGDNRFVATHTAEEIGLASKGILTGEDLQKMHEQEFSKCVHDNHIFAEVEPAQKERIITALRKRGVIVGYMGDGINDVTALHAADVGISIGGSADVVKEEADIVLLKKDLSVLFTGIQEGRRTFANTMKYIFMATSANFGNMFSMAGASLFLSFLPLLPKQILFINLLTDFPEMAIATDEVDPERLRHPQRWDIRFIRKFMIVFGIISSVFDFLTFGVLFFVLRASESQFRTGWFVESVTSAAMIVFAIRTARPFYRSRPSRYLLVGVLLVAGVACYFPFSPLAPLFNFTPLPLFFYGAVGAIVLTYFVSVEVAKSFFFKK
ncbi:MAG: magnesium-translocating P-type ATPase [Chlamydiales bacterium]